MKDLAISEPIEFEWDKYNQTKIRLRHGITTEEAEQTFFNDYSVKFDELHSAAEQHYHLLGDKQHRPGFIYSFYYPGQ